MPSIVSGELGSQGAAAQRSVFPRRLPS